MSSGKYMDEVLNPEEKAILDEQRKRASSDTQGLIKIIDRLCGLIAEPEQVIVVDFADPKTRERVLRNVKAE